MTAVGHRLRSLHKRGKVRNRPSENPYWAGSSEWALVGPHRRPD